MRPSLAQKKSFATANVCYAHPTSCHAGVCDVAEGFCVTAARLHETSRFPMGRMRMDDIEFHGEPPPISPRWSWRLGLGLMPERRQRAHCAPWSASLAATPLATIDPEAFVDFTTIRPVVRLNAEGERTIRWPRIAFWTWQPPDGGAGLLLFRGVEPQLRWRTYATLLLDVAARCGVQRLVSLGAVLAAVPHTRPPLVTGSSTDPAWHARLEACGIRTRRSRYEGPTGMSTVVVDAATRGALRAHLAGAGGWSCAKAGAARNSAASVRTKACGDVMENTPFPFSSIHHSGKILKTNCF